MDFKDLIRLGYDEYLDDLKSHLSGLTPEERRFPGHAGGESH